jgi:lipoprotein
MRNYLYIILFLLLGTSCISAQKPVATIHGYAFHLDDSLTIGLPHDDDPSGIYKALSWSQEDMEIPAFAKGELKIHIKPFKMNVFGERINEPDTVFFLSLPQYPKDSLIIDLKEAVERGEILTEPIREDKTLYPEAVELRPSDYIVALIKLGTLTYTDEVIQVYAKNLKDREQTSDDIDDPRKFRDSERPYWRS